MDNKDAMLREFFAKVKGDQLYGQFAKLNHDFFVQVMERFKIYAKEHFDSRVNDLHKLFLGDQNIVVPAQETVKSELDSLLPDIIRTHAWFLVEEIKKHTDAMIEATENTPKELIKH